MGAEAKRYLQEHDIPQLFESLITGLICNKPEDPIAFLECALTKVRQNSNFEYRWDSFVDEAMLRKYEETTKRGLKAEKPKKGAKSKTRAPVTEQAQRVSSNKSTASSMVTTNKKISLQPPSATQNPETVTIPDVPIILFMGGPGGGKTRHAARVQEALSKFGLVHICMPDMIRAAIAKYKNTNPDWKEAAERYGRGELIPNNLALGLVQAEMRKHQDAKAFFLEGFPREARQVESFEREVRPVNMALILDYDENTLRHHMENRGLDTEIIDAKIREFKLKTLPSAKYFDDQRLLHLIPGEQTDQWIFERMKMLIQRAMELGIPITTSKVASRIGSPLQRPDTAATVTQAAAIVENAVATAQASEIESRPATKAETKVSEKKDSKPTTATGTKVKQVDSPVATNDVKNTVAAASERSTPETGSEGSLKEKPSTASKQKSSIKGNSSSESKTEKTKADSSIEQVDDIEVHERPQISEAISETVKQSTPMQSIPGKEEPNLEKSSQSSKQSSRSDTKTMSYKVSRTASQASKSSEISHQSIYGIKSENQSAFSIKSETQLTDASESNASEVNNRFPSGLPNKASVIVIAGPPGSNKEEISKRVAEKYDGFLFLSMGDLLRKEIEANADDQLWQRIGKKINAGEPVPTKICRELLYSKIYDADNVSSGYVIEGYPRAKNQAIDFENQIGRLDLVILIDCTEEFCAEIIEKHKNAGMEVRPNDNPEALKTRLQMFKQNTLPMLKYFDDKKKLKVVDGGNNPDKIFDEIVEEINRIILGEEQKDEKSRSSSKASRKKTAKQ